MSGPAPGDPQLPSVHVVDGTFELFRCFHGAPRARNAAGFEVGAVRGLLATLVALLHQPGVSHVAVAFDSVVPPQRSPAARAASDEQLIATQAGLAAEAVRALGLHVWPSARYQADELLATAAARYAADPAVGRVVICSNDNDFAQCVRGTRVVVLDRIRNVITDEAAVRDRWGIAPQQIPDLFALIGDRSDGLPGVPGWGTVSAAMLLRRYDHVDRIPLDERDWDVAVGGAARLGAALREWREETLLCRDLSRLRTDLPLRQGAADLQWLGADRARIERLCATVDDAAVLDRIERWRS